MKHPRTGAEDTHERGRPHELTHEKEHTTMNATKSEVLAHLQTIEAAAAALAATCVHPIDSTIVSQLARIATGDARRDPRRGPDDPADRGGRAEPHTARGRDGVRRQRRCPRRASPRPGTQPAGRPIELPPDARGARVDAEDRSTRSARSLSCCGCRTGTAEHALAVPDLGGPCSWSMSLSGLCSDGQRDPRRPPHTRARRSCAVRRQHASGCTSWYGTMRFGATPAQSAATANTWLAARHTRHGW